MMELESFTLYLSVYSVYSVGAEVRNNTVAECSL